VVAGHEPEDDDPQRNGCDHQGGEARRNRALREHDKPVAAGKEQRPDQRRPAEPRAVDAQRGAAVTRDKPRAQDRAREEKAQSSGEERRERLDRNGDREIRGSPDEVDDPERGPDEDA